MVFSFLLIACDSIQIVKEEEVFFCRASSSPECVDGHEWEGTSLYCFNPTNFGCEVGPVNTHYMIDISSFMGIPDADIPSEDAIHSAVNIAKLKWNGVGANVTIEHDMEDVVVPPDVPERSIIIGMLDFCDTENKRLAVTDCYWTTPETGYERCTVMIFSQYVERTDRKCYYSRWDFSDKKETIEDWQYSLPSLLTHEFGHTLGLDDNDIASSAMKGVLKGGEIIDPGQSTDDTDALKYIYYD